MLSFQGDVVYHNDKTGEYAVIWNGIIINEEIR